MFLVVVLEELWIWMCRAGGGGGGGEGRKRNGVMLNVYHVHYMKAPRGTVGSEVVMVDVEDAVVHVVNED